jgi:hypothetical protein
MNPKKIFQFDLEPPQIEQGRTGQRVNQQIEIATVPVRTAQDGPEDPRVRRTVATGRFANRNPLEVKGNRWFHGYFAA